MTWAKRVFKFIESAQQPVSAKRLEIAYQVPEPRRVLASLRQQDCIEEAFRLGGERFWRIKPGAGIPEDRRIEQARQRAPIALRARQIKRLRRQ
jgi:hypothetical protein